jgi:hypothetical protein
MFYKCHNCGAGKTFGGLLKDTDPLLHKEYVLERYKAGVTAPRANTTPDFSGQFSKPDFGNNERLIDSLMDRVDKLEDSHMAVQYCEGRKIPREKWDRLYHIDDISKIHQLAPKYKNRIQTTEPRLAIPFFSKEGVLTGLTLRDYGNNPLRYIMVKINEEAPTIFGLDVISNDTPVKIVGNRVVIWPDAVEQKDINDMVMANLDVEEIINYNTFQNLEAELKFTTWRKC